MQLFEIFVIAIGLSMDASAAALSLGLAASPAHKLRHAFICALYFAIAQTLMPLLGYALGAQIAEEFSKFSPFIVFAILAIIGGKTIIDGIKDEKKEKSNAPAKPHHLFLLAIATSIDALAIGVGFSFTNAPIILSAAIIGIVCFLLSLAGFFAGKFAGSKLEGAARIIGGIALLAIAIKSLF